MTRFAFSFGDVESEVESLLSMAGPFLDPDTIWVLHDFKSQLERIRNERDRDNRWEIRLDNPLLTRPCEGAYQSGGGRHNAYAAISSTWTVRPHADQPEKLFEVTGNASCLVVLLEGPKSDPVELGRFHIDMGVTGGPGTLFHVQFSEQPEARVFPTTLDVPRLPTLPLTPPGVIELMLGELFQDEWVRRVSQRNGPQTKWIGIQRRRFVNFMDWQLQLLCRDAAEMSPLMTMKRGSVQPDLFLDTFTRRYAAGC